MQEVCAFVSKTAGTVALRAGTLQRLFRDMNAGTPHITSAQVSSAPPAVSSQASHLANVGFFGSRGFSRLGVAIRRRLAVIAAFQTNFVLS